MRPSTLWGPEAQEGQLRSRGRGPAQPTALCPTPYVRAVARPTVCTMVLPLELCPRCPPRGAPGQLKRLSSSSLEPCPSSESPRLGPHPLADRGPCSHPHLAPRQHLCARGIPHVGEALRPRTPRSPPTVTQRLGVGASPGAGCVAWPTLSPSPWCASPADPRPDSPFPRPLWPGQWPPPLPLGTRGPGHLPGPGAHAALRRPVPAALFLFSAAGVSWAWAWRGMWFPGAQVDPGP